MLKSNNPVFTGDTFSKPQTWDQFQSSPGARGSSSLTDTMARQMTIAGTINATLILLAITSASAVGAWALISPRPNLILPVTLGATIVGFFSFFAVRSKPNAAMVTAPIFAVVEGLFVGAISLLYAKYFGTNPGGPALVITAVLGTFGVAGAMLVAYYFRLVRSSPMFVRVIGAAWLGVMILIVSTWVLRFFGLTIPYIWDTGPIGIAVTLIIIGLAAATLVVDFAFIEEGEANAYPKQYEWVGAFGLLVTLVTLYVWILRLLAMLRSND